MDATSSDTSNQKTFWNCIWKLRVPNKIKTFLWRVCSEALPTKENLRKRKIIDNADAAFVKRGRSRPFMPFRDVIRCGIFGNLYLVGSIQTF